MNFGMKGGMEKIRAYYGVPAKRGMRVKYAGLPATIISSNGQYLRLRFDSGMVTIHHPLYEIDYLDGIDYAARYDERIEKFNAALNPRQEAG